MDNTTQEPIEGLSLSERTLKLQKINTERKSKKSLTEKEIASDINGNKIKVRDEQMKSSREIIKKITDNSSQMVLNVKLAICSDEHENAKKTEEKQKIRQEKLEREQIVGAAHFKEILNKWEDILQTTSPSEMHQKLMEQKLACEAVINEKNQLIKDLTQEIDEMGEEFETRAERQEDEIEINVDRCRQQIKLLKKCHEKEIKINKEVHAKEWKSLFEEKKLKFNEALEQFNSEEAEQLVAFDDIYKVWEKELGDLNHQKYEEYKNLRNSYDKAVQILQLQLQETKFVLQLNREKLEYTHQLLRKREEEQLSVKAEQRRQLTKLYNTVSKLQTKVIQKEKVNREKSKATQFEFDKMLEQVETSDRKVKQYIASEEKKFKEIWKMNDETCKLLVKRLHESNQIVDNEILKRSTDSLPKPFFELDEKGETLIVAAKKTVRPSAVFRVGFLTAQHRRQQKKSSSILKLPLTSQVMLKLLETLVEVASHLIDTQTVCFTSNLNENEKLLVSLDDIFTALEVQNDIEVDALLHYLYSKCVHNANATTSNEVSQEVLITKELIMPAIQEFIENRSNVVWLNQYYSRAIKMQKQPDLSKQDIENYWRQYLNLIPASKLQLWDYICRGLKKMRVIKMETKNLQKENQRLRQVNNELRCLLTPFLQSLRAPA